MPLTPCKVGGRCDADPLIEPTGRQPTHETRAVEGMQRSILKNTCMILSNTC